MASLYESLEPGSLYKDPQYEGSLHEYQADLKRSSTLYVGNLSFYTTEEQIYELFERAGPVKRVIMGLDKNKRTPCGFAFVEYFLHDDAADAVRYVNQTKLDERLIRVDWDPGFVEGRQFGRGKSGGQVRDEFRDTYDVGRGGYGSLYVQAPKKKEEDGEGEKEEKKEAEGAEEVKEEQVEEEEEEEKQGEAEDVAAEERKEEEGGKRKVLEEEEEDEETEKRVKKE
eukprot:TRINITY_DN800_c0_g2_i1.p2 TRINITY_DN800_c0_g2~~TRINITY_DN800_c0_g2_i1.p2  ORF type:complete len:227 (+),score=-22.48 TRINITY_DN800_c0_g2_i1:1132-1812(+)